MSFSRDQGIPCHERINKRAHRVPYVGGVGILIMSNLFVHSSLAIADGVALGGWMLRRDSADEMMRAASPSWWRSGEGPGRQAFACGLSPSPSQERHHSFTRRPASYRPATSAVLVPRTCRVSMSRIRLSVSLLQSRPAPGDFLPPPPARLKSASADACGLHAISLLLRARDSGVRRATHRHHAGASHAESLIRLNLASMRPRLPTGPTLNPAS